MTFGTIDPLEYGSLPDPSTDQDPQQDPDLFFGDDILRRSLRNNCSFQNSVNLSHAKSKAGFPPPKNVLGAAASYSVGCRAPYAYVSIK